MAHTQEKYEEGQEEMTEEEANKYLTSKNRLIFILDENKNPVNATPVEFENALSSGDFVLRKTLLNGKEVSTVFLGIDMSFGLLRHQCKPLLFETMIFTDEGKNTENYQERYATYQEALKGHEKAIQWVKDGCKDDE